MLLLLGSRRSMRYTLMKIFQITMFGLDSGKKSEIFALDMGIISLNSLRIGD